MNRLVQGLIPCVALGCAAVVLSAAEAGPVSSPEPSLHDLRAKILATDQVLLEYRFDPDRGAVHLVSQDRERTVPIPAGRDSLRALVASLRAQLHSGDAALPAAVVLHAILIDPVAADLPPESRLVVVPGETLRELPFAALGGADAYLVRRHAISVVPTSASIALPGAKRPPRPKPVLQLAPAAADSFLAANGAALHALDVVPASAIDSLRVDLASGLEEGLPPDIALQRAQIAAIDRDRPPAEWASFVVTGRMSAPRSTGTFPAWLIPLGLALGALTVAVALKIAPRSRPRGESG